MTHRHSRGTAVPYHPVRRRTESPRPDAPFLPVITAVIGVLLVAGIFVVNMLGTLSWPERVNPPGMDLSRRAVFALASALELYGAGLIGFALGVSAAQRRAIAGAGAAERALRLRSWRGPMFVIGLVLILAAGRFEYLALVGGLD